MCNTWVYWLILSEWVVIHNSGSRALYYMLTAYTISLYQSEENSSTVLLMRWYKNLMCHEFGIFIISFLFLLFPIHNTTFITLIPYNYHYFLYYCTNKSHMIFHHSIIIWQLALLSLLRPACNLVYTLLSTFLL